MKKKYVILIGFFIGMMIFSLVNLLSWHFDNKETSRIVIKEKVHLNTEEEVYRLNPNILRDNSDTVGWLIVPGTSIDYPVLQYRDNDYYLNHDFNHRYSKAGWIFMDYRNQMQDQNLVIYGHHRRDGSMFGSMSLLFDKDFYKEHNEILLVTPEEVITYVIFSVYSIRDDDPYIRRNFDDFSSQLELFKSRSVVPFDVSLEGVDQIITLSTCNLNNVDRDVVHAYKKNI